MSTRFRISSWFFRNLTCVPVKGLGPSGMKFQTKCRSAWGFGFPTSCCLMLWQHHGSVALITRPSRSCTSTKIAANCRAMSSSSPLRRPMWKIGMPFMELLLQRLRMKRARRSCLGTPVVELSGPLSRKRQACAPVWGMKYGRGRFTIGRHGATPAAELLDALPRSELLWLVEPSSEEAPEILCPFARRRQQQLTKPRSCRARARAWARTASCGSALGTCKMMRSISLRLTGLMPTR
mmetsp:Transcript_23868/g.68288  ORF Transcript_23868/g.68288 Transcript_23868/m.68288 type:complete len:237 (-) Transcript_23868:815-1525(-)